MERYLSSLEERLRHCDGTACAHASTTTCSNKAIPRRTVPSPFYCFRLFLRTRVEALATATTRLDDLSPLTSLARGFAIVERVANNASSATATSFSRAINCDCAFTAEALSAVWRRNLMSETFEEALAVLEESVQRLEAGDLKLEEALEVFEKGVAASRACGQWLDQTRERVQVLTADAEGQFRLSFLDDEDDH